LLLLAMGCATSAPRPQQTEPRGASPDDSNSGRSIAERVAKARTALHDTAMKFGADAPQTLEAADQLAAALEMEGDYAGAAALYDRAVKRRLKLLGPRDTRTTASIARLAAAYLAAGSYEKAEPLFYRVLDVTGEAAPNGESTAEVLNNLGVLY